MAKTIKELSIEMLPISMVTGHNCEYDANEDRRKYFEQGADIILNRLCQLVSYYKSDGVSFISCEELESFITDLRL